MSRPYVGELPASKAILGLVIERPNETVSMVAQLLAQRFEYAHWSTSTAYNTLPQLAKLGLVLRTYAAPAPGKQRAPGDRYEATEEGNEDFREWMRDCSVAPLRESIHGQIEFLTRDDLPSFIEMVRSEQEQCEQAFRDCGNRLQSFEAATLDPGDWRAEVRAALMTDQGMIWKTRIRRLARLCRSLEQIHAGNESSRADYLGG